MLARRIQDVCFTRANGCGESSFMVANKLLSIIFLAMSAGLL
jgi:hypothetical protein